MDTPEILMKIRTSAESTDLDADTAVRIYAQLLNMLQGVLPEADMQRLIVLAAAMSRNSSTGAELQMPVASSDSDPAEPPSGSLH